MDCTLEQLHIMRSGPAEFVLKVPVHPSQLGHLFGRESPTVRDGPSAFTPDLPIGTLLSSSLRQKPPGLRRYRWRLFGDGIVEGRSTEIEHGLRRQIILHQADDGYTGCATAACLS